MMVEAVNRLFARLGLSSAPSEPALPPFRPEDICTSDPERRVPPSFLGEARPSAVAHHHGIAPAPRAAAPLSRPTTWTPQQYERFAARVREYLAQNDTLLPHHAAWHEVNGPGGSRGPGSGTAFLQMHHEMIVDMERFIRASGRDLDLVPLVEWRPTQVVPPQLGNVERYSTTPNVRTPSWLTSEGGTERAPIFGYTRLADFKSLDELGRAFGSGPPDNLGYHGAGHAGVGGVMWSRRAPVDPVFWLWHRHIDNIVETWLATENGRAWAATDEGRAWREATGHHHHAAPGDKVHERTEALLRMRAANAADYETYMSGSSFDPPVNAWPADALPINVQSSERMNHLGVTVQTLASDLRVPWGMAFAPNGDVYFTERGGRVRVIRDGVVQSQPVLTIPVGGGEGGLLGIALDPDFARNNLAYLYYTTPGSTENRVVRVPLAGPNVGQQSVIVSGIPASGIHNGGRIAFGPDGKLYITTGDAARSNSAQDLRSLGGKILRVNRDGSAPADNPFVGRADADARIWTYGHRNPQGLSWNSRGELIASELGGASQDEINLIRPGSNYGWPEAQGDSHRPPFTAPLAHAGRNPSWAPSGGTFLTSGKIPQWQDRYFMAMLGFGPGAARGLRMFELDENNQVSSQTVLFRDVYGRVRNVMQGPDGYLYVTTSNHDGRGEPGRGDDQILRIVPSTAR